MIEKGKSREEALVRTRHRYAIYFGRVYLTVVLLSEVDHVGWLAHRLLQVPDHEVLALVDCEEFAHARGELYRVCL